MIYNCSLIDDQGRTVAAFGDATPTPEEAADVLFNAGVCQGNLICNRVNQCGECVGVVTTFVVATGVSTICDFILTDCNGDCVIVECP